VLDGCSSLGAQAKGAAVGLVVAPQLITWIHGDVSISVGHRYVRNGLAYRCVALAQMERTGESVVVFIDEDHGRVWVLSAAEFADGRFKEATDENEVKETRAHSME